METFLFQLDPCHKYIKITCSLWLIKDDLSTCSLAQIAAVITKQLYLPETCTTWDQNSQTFQICLPILENRNISCSNFQFEIVWVNYFCL